MRRFVRASILLVVLINLAAAHVGSPDIYLDGNAGPYKLFVTIRPPQVIPGVAEILVRSQTTGVTAMSAVPLPLSGPGADHPPLPDALVRSQSDAQFFTGSLWLMADGSWQVRIVANGSNGSGTLAIPVPAIAQTTRRMDASLGVILSVLAIFLVGGLAAICGATVREAKLDMGTVASETNKRKGRIAVLVSFAVIAAVLTGGYSWWDSEADVYKGRVYKPLKMGAQLEGNKLLLNLSEPGWMQSKTRSKSANLNRVLFVRRMDDLVPDHNHLMHLYVIRQPGLDVIYHLHPDIQQPDQFSLSLPAMPAGDYKLYADVVHENGLPETLVSSLHLANGLSGTQARPLAGDDASVETLPVQMASLTDAFTLPDGYKMRWVHDGSPLHAREGSAFQFELLTPDGNKPKDMALYMGMLGHAAFLKTDGSVFAHIHPNGTVAMSAFMKAQGMEGMQMSMDEGKTQTPNVVSFPYGLPSAGHYRIFVQMKHGDTVETGVFDAWANP
jgi:hypothetical protein